MERYNGHAMTIDERLEALTQSLELLSSFHRDTEAAMQKLDEKLSAQIAKVDEKFTAQMTILTGHMNTMAHLLLKHEQRVQDLESN